MLQCTIFLQYLSEKKEDGSTAIDYTEGRPRDFRRPGWNIKYGP